MSQLPTPQLAKATEKITDKMFAEARAAEKNKQAAKEHLLAIQLILAKRPI